jgi:hypothetical protein
MAPDAPSRLTRIDRIGCRAVVLNYSSRRRSKEHCLYPCDSLVLHVWKKAVGEMARLTIYRAFIEGALEVPKHLTCISIRSTRNSHRVRSGASQTHLLQPSRNWIRFRNLRRQRNWGNFWSLGSRSRSSVGRYRPAAVSIIIVARRALE